MGVKGERVGGQKTGSWELTAMHDTLQTFQMNCFLIGFLNVFSPSSLRAVTLIENLMQIE